MRHSDSKNGFLESFAAKCGLSSSKLLLVSVLVVLLAGVSYVLLAAALPNAPANITFEQNNTQNYDRDGTFTINWSAVTNENISNYTVYIYNNTGGALIVASNTSLKGYFFTGVNGGNYTFNISAVNTTGNAGPNTTSTWMFVDTVAPTITVFANPPNASVVSNKQTLTFNISVIDGSGVGASACKVNVANVANVTGAITNNWCNVTGVSLTDLALGTQIVNIYINDTLGNLHYNNSYAVTVGGQVIPGVTQWNTSNPAPSVNLSEGDMFFYDGNIVSVIANYTTVGSNGITYPYDNLTVNVNFSAIGNASSIAATQLGGGLYRVSATVNYTNITLGGGSVSNFAGGAVTFLAYNYTGPGQPSAIGSAIAVLVNMSTIPSCPPQGQPLPPVVPWNGSLRNVTSCVPATQAPCSTVDTPVYQINSTHVNLCGPTFGPATTNFSQIAQTGNFSAVPLVMDVAGKAKINFSANPVDMSTQQKAQAIMEFAMKNLMSRGQFGINESEWNGQGGKPNLNISATLTLYNISSLLNGNHYSIGFGNFSGMDAPTSMSVCPPARCSGIIFANGNLTFTVSSFSSYVVSAVNYTVRFANVSGPISKSVNPNVNATYYINISNAGNNSDEITYNLSVQGIGFLNRSQITLNSTGVGGITWQIVELNVLNATAGTHYTNVTAVLSDNASIIFNSRNDGLNAQIATTVNDIVAPVVAIHTPANGALLNYRPYINGTATDIFLEFIKTNNSANYPGIDNSTPFNFSAAVYADGTYTINISANDTSGNIGWANVTFTVDTTRPAITIQSPANSTYNTTSVWFNITGSETLSWAGYSLDGATNVSLSNTTGKWWANNASMAQETPHTAVFWFNDSAGNMNSTSISFTIDAAAPKYSLNQTNSTYAGKDVLLSLYWTDNIQLSNYIFSFDNGTGSFTNSSPASLSGTGNWSNVTRSINTTINATIRWQVYTNDSIGNLNASEIFSFATSACAESWSYSDWSACSGGTQTRTAIDANGCGTTENRSALSQSCSSGSSGSGGGGGGSITPAPPSHANIWIKVTPGAATIMKVTKPELGITEISIEVNNAANNVKITVTKLEGAPASITHEVSGTVYKYLEIKKENLNDSALKKGVLKFKVEKSWLNKNKFDKSTVALNRYVNGAWVRLSTKMLSEDGTNAYYEADTPGFSYFAISAQEKQAEPTQQKTSPENPQEPPLQAAQPPGSAVEQNATAAPAKQSADNTVPSGTPSFAAIIFVTAAILILAIVALRASKAAIPKTAAYKEHTNQKPTDNDPLLDRIEKLKRKMGG